METRTFEAFRSLIYRESGIVLTPQKMPLLAGRIQKRLNALGIGNESAYLKMVELDVSGSELIELLDAISTNVTYFYREPAHFELYRKIVKSLAHRGHDEIRIWCAAASSGEEPYTLAFETLEALTGACCDWRMLATDISLTVLRRATDGVYSSTVVEKIDPEIRNKYLNQVDESEWKVKESISKKILFKRLNLIAQPYPLKGPFDVIFCRNVMIYFDNETRESIVRQFERLLNPRGFLFLSHSENLLGVNHGLDKISASVFRRPK
jgi:chemotaxis protein methyltransferase CheR